MALLRKGEDAPAPSSTAPRPRTLQCQNQQAPSTTPLTPAGTVPIPQGSVEPVGRLVDTAPELGLQHCHRRRWHRCRDLRHLARKRPQRGECLVDTGRDGTSRSGRARRRQAGEEGRRMPARRKAEEEGGTWWAALPVWLMSGDRRRQVLAIDERGEELLSRTLHNLRLRG